MVTTYVKSLKELTDLISKSIETSSRIVILFMASIDPETGKSWCPDCRDADPVVLQAFDSWHTSSTKGSKALFITCFVGQKVEWKTPDCEFKGPPYDLKCVPTLIVHGIEGRMEEGQLLKKEDVIAFMDRD